MAPTTTGRHSPQHPPVKPGVSAASFLARVSLLRLSSSFSGRRWTLKMEDLPLMSGGPNEREREARALVPSGSSEQSPTTISQNCKDSWGPCGALCCHPPDRAGSNGRNQPGHRHIQSHSYDTPQPRAMPLDYTPQPRATPLDSKQHKGHTGLTLPNKHERGGGRR